MKYMLEKINKSYSTKKEKEETSVGKSNIRKEHMIYNSLCNNLSKKERELFNEFMDHYSERHGANIENAYKDGFIAGALLMIEIFSAE